MKIAFCLRSFKVSENRSLFLACLQPLISVMNIFITIITSLIADRSLHKPAIGSNFGAIVCRLPSDFPVLANTLRSICGLKNIMSISFRASLIWQRQSFTNSGFQLTNLVFMVPSSLSSIPIAVKTSSRSSSSFFDFSIFCSPSSENI